jgi:hypothetical protein
MTPFAGQGAELSSIPHVAFSPVIEHFTAANSPQQI